MITSLFHDLGKCVHKMENGDLVEYYLPQDSDWHKKQGMVYKYNDAIPYMTIPDRSLWMLQLFDSRKEDDVTVYLRPDLVIVRTRSLDGTSWENIMPLKLAKLKGLIGNIIARAGDTAIQIPRSPTKHEINPEMYDSNNRRIFRR